VFSDFPAANGGDSSEEPELRLMPVRGISMVIDGGDVVF
jgi:hypothetical protein